MSEPCLCGDPYCPSCGNICPTCEGEGFIQMIDAPDLYKRCSCNMTPEEEEEYLKLQRGEKKNEIQS